MLSWEILILEESVRVEGGLDIELLVGEVEGVTIFGDEIGNFA